MRFSTLAALALPLGSLALTGHSVTVSDMTVRNIENSIESVQFSIDNVTCSAAQPTEVIKCGESQYRFYIVENSLASYNLTIYEETGPAVGLWRREEIETICRAGGTGPTDYVCDVFHDVPYVLTFDGQ